LCVLLCHQMSRTGATAAVAALAATAACSQLFVSAPRSAQPALRGFSQSSSSSPSAEAAQGICAGTLSAVTLVAGAAVGLRVASDRRAATQCEAEGPRKKQKGKKGKKGSGKPRVSAAVPGSVENATLPDKVAAAPVITYDPSKEIGTAPWGFFDPAGFIGNDEGKFRRFRSAEIKHGRAAMMASVGFVGQHYIKFPGFEDAPSGLLAVSGTNNSVIGYFVLLAFSGIMEIFVWTQDAKKEPGNFGDPLGVGMYDDDMRNKEINNGRMAMFAVMGIMMAEVVTGKDGVSQIEAALVANGVIPESAAISASAAAAIGTAVATANATAAAVAPVAFDGKAFGLELQASATAAAVAPAAAPIAAVAKAIAPATSVAAAIAPIAAAGKAIAPAELAAVATTFSTEFAPAAAAAAEKYAAIASAAGGM